MHYINQLVNVLYDDLNSDAVFNVSKKESSRAKVVSELMARLDPLKASQPPSLEQLNDLLAFMQNIRFNSGLFGGTSTFNQLLKQRNMPVLSASELVARSNHLTIKGAFDRNNPLDQFLLKANNLLYCARRYAPSQQASGGVRNEILDDQLKYLQQPPKTGYELEAWKSDIGRSESVTFNGIAFSADEGEKQRQLDDFLVVFPESERKAAEKFIKARGGQVLTSPASIEFKEHAYDEKIDNKGYPIDFSGIRLGSHKINFFIEHGHLKCEVQGHARLVMYNPPGMMAEAEFYTLGEDETLSKMDSSDVKTAYSGTEVTNPPVVTYHMQYQFDFDKEGKVQPKVNEFYLDYHAKSLSPTRQLYQSPEPSVMPSSRL